MAEVITFPLTDADHHAARLFVCVTVPLLALAIAVLVTRITLKLRASLKLGWDDYLLTAGLIFAIGDWALLLVSCSEHLSSSKTSVTWADIQRTIEIGVIAVPIWSISVTCTKIGVAIQLLRFQQSRGWRISLYVLIGIVLVSSVAYSLFDLLQCIPLAATWDTTIVGAKCVDHNTFRIVANVQSGISISTDVFLSIFPLTFLHKLRRPLTEKVLVHILMAMGLAASSASITKTVIVAVWVSDVDSFKVGFTISLWTAVEMIVGSIAACLPSLKSGFQKLLTHLGVDFTSHGTYSFFRSFTRGTVRIPTPPEPPKVEKVESSESSQTLGKAKSADGGYEELEVLSNNGKTKFLATV